MPKENMNRVKWSEKETFAKFIREYLEIFLK